MGHRLCGPRALLLFCAAGSGIFLPTECRAPGRDHSAPVGVRQRWHPRGGSETLLAIASLAPQL